MPDYRRNLHPGATFFFTVVTHDRRPILTTDLARSCLRRAILETKAKHPFDLVAIVLLADHLHTVWGLPPGDAGFPARWAQIKERFTRYYLTSGGQDGCGTLSRDRHRERAVWQRSYWEHTCRDEEDLGQCIDYLHWNPVKHGLVRKVREYPWSSFPRFVRSGDYDAEWGGTNPCPAVTGAGWE